MAAHTLSVHTNIRTLGVHAACHKPSMHTHRQTHVLTTFLAPHLQIEALQERVQWLTAALTARNGEVAALQARIFELESALAVAEAQLAALPRPGSGASHADVASPQAHSSPGKGGAEPGRGTPGLGVASVGPGSKGSGGVMGMGPGVQMHNAGGGLAATTPSGAILATASMAAAAQARQPHVGAASGAGPPRPPSAGSVPSAQQQLSGAAANMLRQQSAPALGRNAQHGNGAGAQPSTAGARQVSWAVHCPILLLSCKQAGS